MRAGKVILFISLILTACETGKDFPLPEENYFVKYYGGAGDQEGVDFVVNPDGSIVLLGNTTSDADGNLIYVVKVDNNGAVLWEHRFGTFSPGAETARDIELHPDGRLVVAGETQKGVNDSDVFLFTLDNGSGLMLDSVRVGLVEGATETNEEVRSVSIIQNGFIVAGASTRLESNVPGANDRRDGMHLKFDNALNWIPEATNPWADVTGENSSDEVVQKVFQIAPNLYYAFGYSNFIHDTDNTDDYNYWVFNFGEFGEPKGVNDRIGVTSEDEILSAVEISPLVSGPGYILTGISRRSTGESRSYIVKLQDNLGVNFITSPTNLGNNVDGLITTKSLSNESFAILSNDNTQAGAGSSISLLRLRRDLTPAWSVPQLFGGAYNDFAGSVAELPNGRLLIIGTMTLGNNGQKKMVLMKVNPDGKLDE